MKNIFITGAGGFLGGTLVKTLSKKFPDSKIKAMVHTGKLAHPDLELLPNVSIVFGDITKPESFRDYLHDVKEVYHLAAYARVWHKRIQVFREINVDGTQNVIEAAIENGVERVVMTSTAGTFGPQHNEDLIDENIVQPLPLFTEYERTKAEALALAKTYTDRIEVVFVSPTRVYGPGELSVSNAVTKVMDKYINTGFRFLPGNGLTLGNYVFVDDIIQGHLLAMEKGKNCENYILGGENLTYRDLFRTVGEVSGIEKKMISTPLFLLMGISYVFKFLADVFKIEPTVLPSFARKYLHSWGTDVTKSVVELGYRFTPFKEGAAKTVEWLRERRNEA